MKIVLDLYSQLQKVLEGMPIGQKRLMESVRVVKVLSVRVWVLVSVFDSDVLTEPEYLTLTFAVSAEISFMPGGEGDVYDNISEHIA